METGSGRKQDRRNTLNFNEVACRSRTKSHGMCVSHPNQHIGKYAHHKWEDPKIAYTSTGSTDNL